MQFIKERVHRVSFDYQPHYFELYLDYIDDEHEGTLIGRYSTAINAEFKDDKIQATMGLNLI